MPIDRAIEGDFVGFFIVFEESRYMASYHHRLKSGKKGSAREHAAYIGREGKYAARGDLLATGVGNMPSWASNDPASFWYLADRYERSNGAAYREHEIALPNELTLRQQIELVECLVDELVWPRPYQWAIHGPESSLEGIPNAHVHIMFSDRVDDGVGRSPELVFRRYNSVSPASGGCRKEGSGRARSEVSEDMKMMRQRSADTINEALSKYGHAERVDGRSLQEQGIERMPERHLGQARIRRMSRDEKASYVSGRHDERWAG